MSAQDHISELQFEAYRGITQSVKKDKGLGMHWSIDPKVAEQRARQRVSEYHGAEGSPTTLKAVIPLSSVETNTGTLKSKGVYTDPRDYHEEKEIPVRAGAPVYVKEVARHSYNRTRTRRYNPPREMTA